jgi:hypothetical protein
MLNKFIHHHYGYLTFAVLGVLSIPISLYLFNAKEFNYDIYLLVLPCIIAGITIFIGSIISLVTEKSYKKLNKIIQNSLSAFALIIFINDFFIPTKATALDGTEINIIEPVLLTLLESIVTLVILVFLVMSLSRKRFTDFFIIVSKYALTLLLLFSIALIYLTIFNTQNNNVVDNYGHQFAQLKQVKKKFPNIYFIWLDGMQSDFFIKGLNEHELSEKFLGFTLFKNNNSNYLYSLQSYQSFMSGTLFKGGDYKAWGQQDILRNTLKQQGYRFTSYTMSNFVSPLDDVSVTIEETFKRSMQLKHPYFSDFLQSWLIRLAPNFLANEAYSSGKVLTDKIDFFLNPVSDQPKINSIIDGMLPFTAPKTIKKAIEDESLRSFNNEFVLIHTILPHTPYIFDTDCNYISPKSSEKIIPHKRYYSQAVCATKMAARLLENLVKLNKYDGSIVVIFGDHGSGWSKLFNNNMHKKNLALNANYSRWKKDHVLMRASAMLMIKTPNNNNPLIISNKETQHIDITPTILSLLALDNDQEFDGRNIFSDSHSKREKIITYYKPTTYPDFDDAEIYQIITDEDNKLIDLQYKDKFHSYFNKKRVNQNLNN